MIGNPNNTRRKAIEKAQREARANDNRVWLTVMKRVLTKLYGGAR